MLSMQVSETETKHNAIHNSNILGWVKVFEVGGDRGKHNTIHNSNTSSVD